MIMAVTSLCTRNPKLSWSDGTAVTYTSFYDYEEQGGDQEMTPTILIHRHRGSMDCD